MSSQEPVVSISCLVYNHSRFLRECLDGFVMQKTDFPFEAIVHDDASTDGSAEIIREYAEKYPEIIRPIYEKENVFSRDPSACYGEINKRIRGKYEAICEGDDYWTDPHKLQRQVDYMEAHPNCSLCFHRARVCYDDHSHADTVYPAKHRKAGEFTFDALLRGNFIATNTVMYRRRSIDSSLGPLPSHIMPLDWFGHLMHAYKHDIGFLPQVMSVYRRNSGSIWWKAGESDDWALKQFVPHMRFYEKVKEYFSYDTTEKEAVLMRMALLAYLRHGRWEEFRSVAERHEEAFDLALKGIVLREALHEIDQEKQIERIGRKLRRYRKLAGLLIGFCLILLIALAARYIWQ